MSSSEEHSDESVSELTKSFFFDAFVIGFWNNTVYSGALISKERTKLATKIHSSPMNEYCLINIFVVFHIWGLFRNSFPRPFTHDQEPINAQNCARFPLLFVFLSQLNTVQMY